MEHGFIKSAIEAGASSLAAQRGFMSNVAEEAPAPDGASTDRRYYRIPDPLAIDAALFGDTAYTLGIDPDSTIWPTLIENVARNPSGKAEQAALRKARADARDRLIRAFPESESSIRSMFDTYASKLRRAAEQGVIIDDSPIERGSAKGLPKWCSPSSWTTTARTSKGMTEHLADVTAAARRAVAAGASSYDVRVAVERALI